MQKPRSVLLASGVSKIGIIYRVGFLQISRFIFFLFTVCSPYHPIKVQYVVYNVF